MAAGCMVEMEQLQIGEDYELKSGTNFFLAGYHMVFSFSRVASTIRSDKATETTLKEPSAPSLSGSPKPTEKTSLSSTTREQEEVLVEDSVNRSTDQSQLSVYQGDLDMSQSMEDSLHVSTANSLVMESPPSKISRQAQKLLTELEYMEKKSAKEGRSRERGSLESSSALKLPTSSSPPSKISRRTKHNQKSLECMETKSAKEGRSSYRGSPSPATLSTSPSSTKTRTPPISSPAAATQAARESNPLSVQPSSPEESYQLTSISTQQPPTDLKELQEDDTVSPKPKKKRMSGAEKQLKELCESAAYHSSRRSLSPKPQVEVKMEHREALTPLTTSSCSFGPTSPSKNRGYSASENERKIEPLASPRADEMRTGNSTKPLVSLKMETTTTTTTTTHITTTTQLLGSPNPTPSSRKLPEQRHRIKREEPVNTYDSYSQAEAPSHPPKAGRTPAAHAATSEAVYYLDKGKFGNSNSKKRKGSELRNVPEAKRQNVADELFAFPAQL